MAKILCFFPNGGTRINKGNADIYQVLNGNVFSNSKSLDLVGAMPNRGAWSSSNLQPSSSVTIPDGYHNGNGYVQAASLDSQWNTIKNKWGITADKIKKGVWIGDVQGTFEIILPPSPFTMFYTTSAEYIDGEAHIGDAYWVDMNGSKNPGYTGSSHWVQCSPTAYDLTYYNSITAVWIGTNNSSSERDWDYHNAYYGLTKNKLNRGTDQSTVSFVRTGHGMTDRSSISTLDVHDLSGSYYISYWGDLHTIPAWMHLNR